MNAQTWLDAQDYAGLRAEVERALAQEPEDVSAWGYGGLAHLLQADPEAAQAWWCQARARLPVSQAAALAQWLETQAQSYLTTQPAVGLGLYQAAYEVAPTPERLCCWIETAAVQDQLTADALERLVQALETTATFPVAPLCATLVAVASHVEFNPLVERLVGACQAHLPAQTYAQALATVSRRVREHAPPAVREKWLLLALETDPDNVDVLGLLAHLYGEMRQYNQARQWCDRQKAVAQTHSLVAQGYAQYCRLQMLFDAGGDAWSEILAEAESYLQLLRAIADPATDFAPALKTLGALLFQIPFFLPYLRDEPALDRPLCNCISTRMGRAVRGATPLFGQPPATSQRLRVGFLSSTFRQHAVGWLARWFFEHYDRERLELFLYCISQPPDEFGHAWFVKRCDHCYYHTNPSVLAAQIARDGIQVLVDMDSLTVDSSCLVLAKKPAPVQVTWLGWDASGLDSVDYFIADPLVLPANAQDYYQETIWRLPETYIAVDGFEVDVPTLRREDLGIEPDAVIFYTAQSSYERHPATVDLQLRILRQVPGSYLCVKGDEKRLQEQLLSQAQVLGVDPARLRFLPPVANEFIQRANLQALADVVLDTYPYNGATTALEALWLGIPLVTRVGQQFAARSSYAFLTQCGIAEGMAQTPEEYVAWGVRLGTDAALRQQIRQRLLESRHTSPLWNGQRFAQQLGAAFQQMWEKYTEAVAKDV
ncbi:MAG: hypothetical protein RMI89_02150 [Gloeomargarita sp. SKYBB_i_bin120]|nr:hypothetical protein [Gloeomargarita sp. SKYG98]MCS7291764.1 hypothetical protein [Gloeomargarita sp. SKYB120]MDW8177324.1 hypothetical protein [Gloeomargarita sp. SKYBB_i_bin120]